MAVKTASQDNPQGQSPRVMTVKTAAPLYDLKPQYLQQLCTRGIVKSTVVGGRHYITPEEMDRVFKGVEAGKTEGKVAPKKATKVVARTRKEVGR